MSSGILCSCLSLACKRNARASSRLCLVSSICLSCSRSAESRSISSHRPTSSLPCCCAGAPPAPLSTLLSREDDCDDPAAPVTARNGLDSSPVPSSVLDGAGARVFPSPAPRVGVPLPLLPVRSAAFDEPDPEAFDPPAAPMTGGLPAGPTSETAEPLLLVEC